MILYLKAFHIVGFVAWFAGLFYLVRMFVYHVEAQDKPQPDRAILTKQFALMEGRVYTIICNPAMMFTWTCGLGMLYLNGWEWFSVNTWMHFKLLLLGLLTAYHIWCKRIVAQLAAGNFQFSSFQFRLLNEVPTLFLLSISLLAVLKNNLHFLYSFLGVMAFGFTLYFAAKAYKRARNKGKV